nr:hypothetical protein [Morchella crassipes]
MHPPPLRPLSTFFFSIFNWKKKGGPRAMRGTLRSSWVAAVLGVPHDNPWRPPMGPPRGAGVGGWRVGGCKGVWEGGAGSLPPPHRPSFPWNQGKYGLWWGVASVGRGVLLLDFPVHPPPSLFPPPHAVVGGDARGEQSGGTVGGGLCILNFLKKKNKNAKGGPCLDFPPPHHQTHPPPPGPPFIFQFFFKILNESLTNPPLHFQTPPPTHGPPSLGLTAQGWGAAKSIQYPFFQ